MAIPKVRGIDADAHIDENEQTWEYLEEAERRFKPISFDLPESEPLGPSDGRRHRLWLIGGNARLRRFRSDEATGTTKETRELIDVDARLRHMDELGLDVQALFPTTFLHQVTDRPEVEVALAKTYNRWMADRCTGSRGRLRWVALMPTLDIDACVKEVDFAKENGACGVMKKGVEAGDRAASDPYFFPLYEACDRTGLPLCFHQGIGDPYSSNTTDNAARMSVLNVISAFSSLAGARVPERFPNVRWGFIEAGASWIPYVIKDLGVRGKAAKAGFNWKSGFLAHNNFFVTCDTEDDVAYLTEKYGAEDYLMIGTDYTHVNQTAEMRAHRTIVEQAEKGEFSSSVATKIIDDNGRRFYGI